MTDFGPSADLPVVVVEADGVLEDEEGAAVELLVEQGGGQVVPDPAFKLSFYHHKTFLEIKIMN